MNKRKHLTQKTKCLEFTFVKKTEGRKWVFRSPLLCEMMKQQASTFLKASASSALLFLLVVGLIPFSVLGGTCDVGHNEWKPKTWECGLEMKEGSTTCEEKDPAWGCFAAFGAVGESTAMTRGCLDKAPSPPMTPGTEAPKCVPITHFGKYKKPTLLCVFTPTMPKNAKVEAKTVEKFLNDVALYYRAFLDDQTTTTTGVRSSTKAGTSTKVSSANVRSTMTTPLILILITGLLIISF